MINLKLLKDNISQIIALTEKNLKLHLRFKSNVIISFITPLITILMPIIILQQFFNFNENFGYWNKKNFLLFQFLAYNIILLQTIINEYPTQLMNEKYWQTLPALIIGPFNRFNLLFGIFFSRLILISIPFTMFFVLSYIFYPISFLTVLFILFILLLIALMFSGIGLIVGIIAISKEGMLRLLNFSISLVIFTSCLSYPFEIFPPEIQSIINLNPLYYIFDFLRLGWIEDDAIISINSHTYNFLLLLSGAIIIPIIGVYLFNLIYKKYGIVGY